jgi:hypothetical protein
MIDHFWQSIEGHFTWPEFCGFVARHPLSVATR